jgi:hypothetical protein
LPDANQPPPGKPGDREERAAIGDDRGLRALTDGEFPPELLAICLDPDVQRLAVRRTGDPDLAEDALLAAAAAVAGLSDLARIKDLKAYFCRVLINEVYHLLGQLSSARPCDPATLVAMADVESSAPLPGEQAVTRLLVQTWLERFRAECAPLRAAVPGRSPQPDRYRGLIVQTAAHILRTALDGNVSWADCNEALQAALPDWFGQHGSAENTCHKHLSRARRDVQDLLRAIVSRDELLP